MEHDFASIHVNKALEKCPSYNFAGVSCEALQGTLDGFKKKELGAERLKVFLTKEIVPLLDKYRETLFGRTFVSYMAKMVDSREERENDDKREVDIFVDHILTVGNALDYLCHRPEEMAKRADVLFKTDLIRCGSLSQVIMALYAYKFPRNGDSGEKKEANEPNRIYLWLIVGGSVCALAIISLLVYFFLFGPKKAAL